MLVINDDDIDEEESKNLRASQFDGNSAPTSAQRVGFFSIGSGQVGY